jgi:uncharacterized membrane protein
MAVESTARTTNIQNRASQRPRSSSDNEKIVPLRVVKDAPVHYSETQKTEKDSVTQFLGWFSVGLGVAELFAPNAVARLIGLQEDEHETLLRAYGMREIAAGVGILTRPKPTYWMWNRVLGDTIDLVSLHNATKTEGNDKARLRLAMLAVLGVTALDIACSARLTSEKNEAAGHDEGSFSLDEPGEREHTLKAMVTVNRPIEDVYEFWKNPQYYPQFMTKIESVQLLGGGRTHWKVKAPAGMSVEWDAEIISDRQNEEIVWTSTDDSNVTNTGRVVFRPAPGDRGTEVHLEIGYEPKGGLIGGRVARLLAAIPKTQVQNDLRRFKQLLEIGEIVQSDATAGPGMPHPAQPSNRTSGRAD